MQPDTKLQGPELSQAHPTGGRRRRLLVKGLGATGAAWVAGAGQLAHAQSDVIKILLGYPAGGAVDVAARAFASELQKVLGTNVVVENKAGAAGTLPVSQLLQSPADGSTFMFAPPDAPIILPLTNPALRYKMDDLLPVAQLCEFSFGLGVGKAVPPGDLKAFLAWARANPVAATYGTPGVGSSMHYIGSDLARVAKTPLIHVPYKGGAQAIVDVIGGQVAGLISTAPILVPQHLGGKLRVLATTGSKRLKQLPAVPTFEELGMSELTERAWFGLFAHRDTQPALVERMSRASGQVVKSTAFIEAMAKQGFEPDFEDAATFAATVRDRHARWAARIKATGLLG